MVPIYRNIEPKMRAWPCDGDQNENKNALIGLYKTCQVGFVRGAFHEGHGCAYKSAILNS